MRREKKKKVEKKLGLPKLKLLDLCQEKFFFRKKNIAIHLNIKLATEKPYEEETKQRFFEQTQVYMKKNTILPKKKFSF